MASQKQVNYALILMQRAGYPTRYMKREHKALGATMRQRSGTVEGWLRGMNAADASALIDRLKAEQPEQRYHASEDAEVKQLRADVGPDADIAELRRIAGLR